MRKRRLLVLALGVFLSSGFLASCGAPADNPGENNNNNNEDDNKNPPVTDDEEKESFEGSGAPSADLGKDGDTYTDKDSGETYTKVDGKWVKDVVESKHYEGAEAPNPELGKDGDTYKNTVTGDEYQKMDGVWVLVKEGDLVEKHIVTFDLAGGTINDLITYGPIEVEHGELLTAPPDPVMRNATFDGWYAQDGNKWSFLVPVMTDLTLTAHYRANAETELKLYVDPDNGETAYEVTTFDGDYVTSKITTPKKDGYDFQGWYFEGTDERFTGTMREEYNGMTIVARWEKSQFNFTYQVENDDTITITGIRNIETVNLVIPAQIDGKTVARLSQTAFQSRIYLTSVTLPSTLVEFNARSFIGCRALTEVLIEGTNPYFVSVGGVIYNKDQSEILFVPPKNTQGSFTLPETVKVIGAYSFYDHGSEGVTSISFHEGITEIKDHAFYGNVFTSLTFPSTLKTIGESAFSCLVEGYIQDIKWNEGLEYIGRMAFAGSYLHDTLEFPSTLKQICSYAFANSTGFNKLILPASLETLEPAAFNGCTGILDVEVEDGNEHYVEKDNLVFTKDMKTVVFCPSGNRGDSSYTIEIPEEVTEIADNAFYMVDNCLKFVIPNTVTKIGKEAFAHCYDLPEIAIPDSVTELGEDAFSSCDSLSRVTIGKGLKAIPKYAFYYCVSLKSIEIPGNVETIGEDAFFGAVLSEIKFNEGLKKIDGGAFYFVPQYSDDGYYAGETETNLTVVTLPDSLEEIGDNAFYGHTKLKQVNVGKGLKAFNPSAFPSAALNSVTIDAENPNLVNENNIVYSKDKTVLYYATENVGGDVILPDSLTTIGDYAFTRHSSVTSLKMGSNVTSIGEGAFYYTPITTLEIPGSVKTIGDDAFYSADIENLTLNEGLEVIGVGAFTYCNLSTLVIPNSVTTISEGAFSMNSNLTNVTFGDSVKVIGDYAFTNSAIEGEVVLPASLEEFGVEVFQTRRTDEPKITNFVVEEGSTHFSSEHGLLMDKDKTKVFAYAAGNPQTSLALPSTVKTIATLAFEKAVNLTSLDLGTSLERIEEEAFSGMSNVSTLSIPASVSYVGNSAFSGFRTTSTINFNCTYEYAVKNFELYFDSGCNATINFLTE